MFKSYENNLKKYLIEYCIVKMSQFCLYSKLRYLLNPSNRSATCSSIM